MTNRQPTGHRQILFPFFLLLLGFSVGVVEFPAAEAQRKNKRQQHSIQQETTAEAAVVLNLINQYRREAGKLPLVMNELISDAAYDHSLKMANGQVSFGHGGFDDRAANLLQQLAPANSVSENVAFSPKGAQSVVNNWLNSDGHRKNIEGDYNYAGVGIAAAKNGYRYYTIIFINKQ